MLISMLCLQNHLFAMAQQHITFLSIWGKNDDLKWLIFYEIRISMPKN